MKLLKGMSNNGVAYVRSVPKLGDGDFRHQGQEISQKRLSKSTDETIHWKLLRSTLVVHVHFFGALAFRFKYFQVKNIFSVFFLKKPQSLERKFRGKHESE
jgi:hypothetical protein